MVGQEIQILYEDEYIIVCDKPHGIPTQTKKIGTPDMVSILNNHLQKPSIHVVHRLDQPVRGIMLFAKTKQAAQKLNKQLNEAGFGKYYRALVENGPKDPEGILENYMIKDGKTNTSRLCKKEQKGSKLAQLQYRTITTEKTLFESCCDEQKELDIKLFTGRHHQIRVQLAGMGCPIVGDHKYNPNKSAGNILCLCAYRLSFSHPIINKKLSFSLI